MFGRDDETSDEDIQDDPEFHLDSMLNDHDLAREYDEIFQIEEEKKSDPQRIAFVELVKHGNDSSYITHLLETPDYKPHQLKIFRGLHQLGDEAKNYENASAVIFAKEYAQEVANALKILFTIDINFVTIRNQLVRTLAYLNMVAAGEDAEKIALAIKRFNKKCDHDLLKFNVFDAYRMIDLFIQLKKANVQITHQLCAFVVGSENNTRNFVIQALIDLEKARISSHSFQIGISIHQQYKNAGIIALLLVYIKQSGVTITDEVVEVVIRQASRVDQVIIQINQLIKEGIKPSIQILTVYYEAESLTKITDSLVKLKRQNMLSGVMLTYNAETKESGLSEQSVIKILESKKPDAICSLLQLQRESIPLEDDFFMECLLLCPDEIKELLQIFSSLQSEFVPLDENNKTI